MLPDRPDIPDLLSVATDETLGEETGVKITVPNGTYRVFYEQFEVPEGAEEKYCQNVVAQRQ